jgi:hypothetical protein
LSVERLDDREGDGENESDRTHAVLTNEEAI